MVFASFVALLCILNFNHFLKAQNLTPKPKTLRQTYIVHVEAHDSNDLDSLYDSFLQTDGVASYGGEQPDIVHRYRHVFKGFSARLSEDELESMRKMEGFVSAQPEQVYKLHTTRSPNFLGLIQNEGFWKDSNYGKGVIIGVIDSGITPDHPSFSDIGMPPPPAKWKGKCEFSGGACNNKLIGARRFSSEEGGTSSPADEDGHGTHTASTAGGNFVPGASFLGNANGTAAGIAPLAHVAVYGVCAGTCLGSDIVAGIDAAIEDGVDILSVSLGGLLKPFDSDIIALGAYRAMEKGILVSCSAGNEGPHHHTVENMAPWIMTVGASTIDRKLRSTVVLGNGQELEGESAFQPPDFNSTEFRVSYFGSGENPESNQREYCVGGAFDSGEVEGTIVVCEVGDISTIGKGMVVKENGGVGMILMNTIEEDFTTDAEAHVLPTSHISYSEATKLKSYLNSTSSPTARIVFKGTKIGLGLGGDPNTLAVVSYSSRGPNSLSPGILKPDIVGPGNNIIAAWNKSPNINDNITKANFYIDSGTSVSCPHLSGVAALVKSVHPDWSPAAIKSAIMTTADQTNIGGKPITDETLQPADAFTIGAGHVNPSKAADPGLIYDIQPDDYIPYLCGLNYTSQSVSFIVQRKVECSSNSSIPEAQLNYPTFSIILFDSTPQTYTRTVTNVGEANSSYMVKIVAPHSVNVQVDPARLQFSKVGEKLKYSVRFSRSGDVVERDDQYSKGMIKWTSSKHSVTTTIGAIRKGWRDLF